MQSNQTATSDSSASNQVGTNLEQALHPNNHSGVSSSHQGTFQSTNSQQHSILNPTAAAFVPLKKKTENTSSSQQPASTVQNLAQGTVSGDQGWQQANMLFNQANSSSSLNDKTTTLHTTSTSFIPTFRAQGAHQNFPQVQQTYVNQAPYYPPQQYYPSSHGNFAYQQKQPFPPYQNQHYGYQMPFQPMTQPTSQPFFPNQNQTLVQPTYTQLNPNTQEFRPTSQPASKKNSPRNQGASTETHHADFQAAFNKTANVHDWSKQFVPTTGAPQYNTQDFIVKNEVIQTDIMPVPQVQSVPLQKHHLESKPFVPTNRQVNQTVAEKPQDDLGMKLNARGINNEDQTKIRELIEEIKKDQIIPIDLLLRFKTLEVCKQKPSTFWKECIERESVPQTLERGSQKQWNQGQKSSGGGRGGYGQGRGGKSGYPPRDGQGSGGGAGGGDFTKNVFKPPVENNLNPLQRAEADKLKEKLKDQSRKVREQATSSKNVHQQIRLIVNVITPDTLEKKFDELRKLIFGELKTKDEEGFDQYIDTLSEQLNEENMQIVVEIIFRKAQKEKEYCTFYGELCEKLIKLELNLRGFEAKQSKIRSSNFRKTLLENCKKSFNEFFDDKIKRESMDEEALYVFRQKLFGNIKFVGELNRRNLLQESIIISVFDMLLAVETEQQKSFVNDITIEGACVLMETVGYLIDAKIKKLESTKDLKPGEQSKKADQIAKFNAIFKKFEQYSAQDSQISNRVRILVINLLDNRAKGWEKTKKQNEAGPKKVEDLRKELERKAREEEQARILAEKEELSYLGQQDQYGGGGGGNKNYREKTGRDRQGGGSQYQKKQGSKNYDQEQQYPKEGDRGNGGGRNQRAQTLKQTSSKSSVPVYVKKQSSVNSGQGREEIQPAKEISDVEIQKKLIENFNTYCQEIAEEQKLPSDHFDYYKELQTSYRKRGEDIFYNFLNKVFDCEISKIEVQLPNYLTDLSKANVFDQQSIALGLNRFLKVYPDLVVDAPNLELWFPQTLQALLEAGSFMISDLVWLEKEESKDGDDGDAFYMSDEYFKLMANLLILQFKKENSWRKVAQWFKENGLKSKFQEIKAYIQQDNIFDEITERIGEEYAEVIVPLIANYEENLEMALSNKS